MAKKPRDLKDIVEQGIKDVLEAKEEPSDGRLKALALGIKMCALNAKLEEDQYGGFFNPTEPGDPGGVQETGKRAARKRAPSTGDGDPDTLTLT